VCFCSFRYPICNTYAPYYIDICGLCGSTTFFLILSHKQHDFSGKKRYGIQNVFWFSVQISLKYFFILRIIWRDIIVNILVCFCSFRYPIYNTYAPYYIDICCLCGYTTFFLILSHKQRDFSEKKVMEYKMCFDFLYKLVWNIFHSKNNSARYYNKYTCVCFCSFRYPIYNTYAPYYIDICGLCGYTTFFLILSHKQHDFSGKKLWNTKCVLIFCTN